MDLNQIIVDQGFPIHPDAAWDAAKRCGGLAWMAVRLQNEMRDVARAYGEVEITPTVAFETFELLGIDEHGVTKEDRIILRLLLTNPKRLRSGELRYAMSEAALCAAAGIDQESYKKRIQPRLFKLGLLQVLAGQALTEKALALYGHLKDQEG